MKTILDRVVWVIINLALVSFNDDVPQVGQHARPHLFSDQNTTTAQENKVTDFYRQWAKEGEKTFGWPALLPMAIVCSPNDLLDKSGRIALTAPDGAASIPNSPTP